MNNIFLIIDNFKDIKDQELTQEDSETLLISMILYEEILDKYRAFLKYDKNFTEHLPAFNEKLDSFRDMIHKHRLSLEGDALSSTDRRLKELGRSISMRFI